MFTCRGLFHRACHFLLFLAIFGVLEALEAPREREERRKREERRMKNKKKKKKKKKREEEEERKK